MTDNKSKPRNSQREMKKMQEARVKEEAGRRERLTAGELSVEIGLQESPYISPEADREKLSQKARPCHCALPFEGKPACASAR